MSRSLKRSPWISCCGPTSDKWWKRTWHQKMRAASRMAMHQFDGERDFLPHQFLVSNVYESRRDCWMRFDPREHPEWMRK